MSTDPDKHKHNSCVTTLKGVGAQVAQRLTRLGIHSVQDLFFHLPLRYQDRTRVVPIASLSPGDEVVVQGVIKSTTVQYGKRRSLLCTISDNSGQLRLRFFHFSANQKSALSEGKFISCFGEVRALGMNKRRMFADLEMAHPEYRCSENEHTLQTENKLTPVYPATEGLQQRSLRSLVDQSLALLDKNKEILFDWLPVSLLNRMDAMSLVNAIHYLHHPPDSSSIEELSEGKHPSQQRLVFEELLARHLCLRQLRNKILKKNALSIKVDENIFDKINIQLQFKLTNAQNKSISEIVKDLRKDHPMQRLVQGDVGCGKTLVAIYSAFFVATAGYQVSVMAPTEILAEQHYSNFRQLAKQLGLEVDLITGKIKGKKRKQLLSRIESGEVHIVIGTHALFQNDIKFSNLAYVIVDEQHRFGVLQRLALLKKGINNGKFPHQLIMSATPIPRSLAMSIYADLDCSVIDEMPPGRSPVNSVVMSDDKREDILSRISQACHDGQQAYWVCPLIEESDVLQCQAAVETASILNEALPMLRIGLIHGRLKAAEKELIMSKFKNHEIDILVATTVIEVGVDVPNASLMVIENSERLGLSQLHQLRGRIGRGSRASNCMFMYSAPLTGIAYKRLSIMRKTNNGFEIAREDMNMRGIGEVFGTRQTGLMQLKIADLPRDEYLLDKVKYAAEHLLEKYPEVTQPLIDRWIGQSSQFWEA